jgi:hypothetical protein
LALALVSFAFAQPPSTPGAMPSAPASAESELTAFFEAKVKAEWDAFANRDKKTYSELLADDYVAVEDDGRGTRNKIHAANEVDQSVVRNYALFAFQVVPLGTDATFVRYEITMQFFPKAQVRFKRVYVVEIWRKINGQWKAWHYQETPVR